MTVGSNDLLKMCRHYALLLQSKKLIFMFDRDQNGVLRELKQDTVTGKPYQSWGNNVFSFAIPIPKERLDETHAICIEFFYSDSDLKKTDENGRRLFLSNEFDVKSGAHSSGGVYYSNKKKLKGKIFIIDSDVFNMVGESMALSKDRFAELVLRGQGEFASIDYSAFSAIIEIIESIMASDGEA